jgi:4-carboxymuconolactone decarboxylase
VSPVSSEPRIPPLEAAADHDPAVAELLAKAGDRASLNIFRTLVKHPRLYKRWVPFGHVLLTGAIPARDRELLVLRTAHLCGGDYEWGHHVRIAADEGITAGEIAGVQEGPAWPGWSDW